MTEDQAHKAIVNDKAVSEEDPAIDQIVARLFDHWRFTAEERRALLGLRDQSFDGRSGDEIVWSNEVAECIGHLLSIHKKLRTLFPQNRLLAYAWMGTANAAFGGRSPLDMVRAEGDRGFLLRVETVSSSPRTPANQFAPARMVAVGVDRERAVLANFCRQRQVTSSRASIIVTYTSMPVSSSETDR